MKGQFLNIARIYFFAVIFLFSAFLLAENRSNKFVSYIPSASEVKTNIPILKKIFLSKPEGIFISRIFYSADLANASFYGRGFSENNNAIFQFLNRCSNEMGVSSFTLLTIEEIVLDKEYYINTFNFMGSFTHQVEEVSEICRANVIASYPKHLFKEVFEVIYQYSQDYQNRIPFLPKEYKIIEKSQ